MTPRVSWNDLDGMFEIPHDAPPKWLCVLSQHMYTAYLDETGIHDNNWIFIAGFIGKKEHWDSFVPRWKIGLGKRKQLHMHELRWGNKSKPTERLLARLGPIPKSCGLRPVVGGIKYSDYQDLIEGTIIQQSAQAYFLCMIALVSSILKFLPPDERVELVFAEQSKYKERALFALSAIQDLINKNPTLHVYRTSDGISKLAGYRFTPYEGTCLFEPADFYAAALAHNFRDAKSKKAKWSSPILNDQDIGHVILREQGRGFVENFKDKILPELRQLGLTWNVSTPALPSSLP